MIIPKTRSRPDSRRPLPGPPREAEPQSSQLLEWPRWLDRASRLGPWVALALLGAGGWLLATSRGVEGLERPTSGLLAVTAALAILAYLLIARLCVARRVWFLRDRLVIRQAWREPVELAYAGYQQDWVVDSTNPRALRVLMFRRNRGCTILAPESWAREAFAEIARIHREEGWYDLEEEPRGG